MMRINWFLASTLLILTIGTSSILANLQFNQVNQPQTNLTNNPLVYPSNSYKMPVLYFQLQATCATTSFVRVKQIEIESTQPTVNFGSGISYVGLYRDVNQNRIFEPKTDLLMSEINTPGGTKQTLSFIKDATSPDLDLVTGNIQSYFILYSFDTSTTIGATANVKLNKVTYLNSATGTDQTATTPVPTTVMSNFIRTSGFVTHNISDISASAAALGETNVEMIKMELKLLRENIKQDTFEITVANAAANFDITTDTTDNGIVNLQLYLDKKATGTPGVFDPGDTKLTDVTISRNTTSEIILSPDISNFTLPASDTIDFQLDQSEILFLTYDIGKDTPFTSSTEFKAQITKIAGIGDQSLQPITVYKTMPAPTIPASVQFGGIIAENVSLMNSFGSSFGPGSMVPMIQFNLAVYGIPTTVNSITLDRASTAQTVPFNTSSFFNGVAEIWLYKDNESISNRSFDANGSDPLQTRILLGQSIPNNSSSVTIPLPTPIFIPTDNASTAVSENVKTFYVFYGVGNTVDLKTTTALSTIVTTVTGNINNTLHPTPIPVKLLNGPVDPNAPITLADTSMTLITASADITYDISPTSAVQGQLKVPLFAFMIDAKSNLSNVQFSLSDILNQLSQDSLGIDRLWIFKDNLLTGTIGKFDSTDEFVTATNALTSLNALLPTATLTSGKGRYFVLGDIGQRAVVGNHTQLRLSGVSVSGNSTIKTGGVFPYPQIPEKVRFSPKYFSITNLAVSSSLVRHTDKPFTVTIDVQSHIGPKSVMGIQPRVYLNNASGLDITNQFSITSTTSTVNVTTRSFVFTLDPVNLISQGSAVIDAFVQYQPTQNHSGYLDIAQLDRYRINATTYQSISPNSPTIALYGKSTGDTASQLESFVTNIQIGSGAQTMAFVSGDAVPAGTKMTIQFANNGLNIDESSLVVTHSNNQTSQKSQSSANGQLFTYNPSTGLLTISGGLGSSSGSLTINAKDRAGNTLSPLVLTFQIASIIQASDFMIYPNPYSVESAAPQFGFNLTQPGVITIDVYNMRGKRVHKQTQSFTTIGYKLIPWVGNANLASGVYLARLTGTDARGNKTMIKTKLAVY